MTPVVTSMSSYTRFLKTFSVRDASVLRGNQISLPAVESPSVKTVSPHITMTTTLVQAVVKKKETLLSFLINGTRRKSFCWS